MCHPIWECISKRIRSSSPITEIGYVKAKIDTEQKIDELVNVFEVT
jgi:hypothetical protein